MENFIACTSMYLPAESQVEAARIAVEQNPLNRPNANGPASASSIILGPDQLAVLTSKYWGNKGVRLTVGFLEQTPLDLQRRILSHFNVWGEFCNVAFSMTQTDPQVRITRSGNGYWSYLGTDVLLIPRNEPTMCLQGFTMQISEVEFRRVVRHEVGHTLGFPHEHMRSQIINRLDPQKTIQYFKQTQGWSAAMVQQQVLTPLAESSIMGTPDADENSIMTYSLPAQITKDGRPIIGGMDIEEQDREFAAKIYPKAPEPPPPPKTGGFELSLDLDKRLVLATLPAGWTIQKKGTAGQGDPEPMPNTESFAALADELESLLTAANASAGPAAAPGGIISNVLALITALRAGNWKAVAVAVRDILNTVLGDIGGGDDSISFQAQAQAAGLDWSKFIDLLLRLLPIILGD